MNTFVGRARELDVLARLRTAGDGPAAALITGLPGSGKSRLLAEGRRLTPSMPAGTVIGSEAERDVPLAAAAALLRMLNTAPGRRGARDDLLADQPGRSHRGPGRRPSPLLAPLRVLEATWQSFRAVAPPLLIIDDLQWVDDLSLALCHYVIRSAWDSGQRLTVWVATRPGGPAQALLEGLPKERVHRIELGPLDRSEAVALARTIDPSIEADAAGALWERAQGSPFWLETLVRHGDAPGTLEQTLEARLGRASRDAAALIGALAVAGREVPVATAGDLLGWYATRTDRAVSELAGRGLAIATPSGVQLAHDLVRVAASASLPDDVRRRFHRRLALRLERQAGEDVGMLRAALEHRRAARMPTVQLARRTARSSQRRLLGSDGLRQLAMLAEEGDALRPETVGLHADLAALADELGEHRLAMEKWSLVAERARGQTARASAMLHASRSAAALGLVSEARELLTLSRETPTRDAVLRVEQHAQDAAVCLWLEHRGPEGRAHARQALSLARAAGLVAPSGWGHDRRRRAYLEVLRLGYEVAMQEGDVQGLMRAARQREAVARGFDLEEALMASLAVGAALRLGGRVHEAVARSRRVWAEARRAVLPHVSVESGYWLARSLAFLGELSEAEQIAAKIDELARRVGDEPRARHRVIRAVANVRIERGDASASLRQLERAVAKEPNEHQRIVLSGDCAVWRARLDGVSSAEVVQAHLEVARRAAAVVGCPRCAAELALLAAEALARVGERIAAQAMLDEWDGLTVVQDELDRIIRLHAGALTKEPPDTRAGQLESALAAAGALPFRLIELWMRLDRGAALAEVGDARAAEELAAVAMAARDRGAETVRMMAERQLRQLGVRPWRRGVSGVPLTGREREVARLVAGGATNREVAHALYLSPKTIERHLANVFRKLEVRNRTELAARLAEAGMTD